VNATQTFYGQRRPPSTTTTTTATAAVDDGRVVTAASASTAWREVACGAASEEELFGSNRKGHDDGDRRRLAAVPATLAHRQEIVQSLQVNFSHENRPVNVLAETSFDNGFGGSLYKKKKKLINSEGKFFDEHNRIITEIKHYKMNKNILLVGL